jgi:hypothetical protein
LSVRRGPIVNGMFDVFFFFLIFLYEVLRVKTREQLLFVRGFAR